MISEFDDFCLRMFILVDDIWRQLAPLFKRPGPEPDCSDSEMITMALVGECRGWDVETEMLSQWKEHRDLFPVIPSQSRFNRRRRNLMQAFNLIRRAVLQSLDLACDRQCIIDSLPVPVVQFYLVPSSTGDWRAFGAAFGKVSSKKETIFGYKLHLLITMGGLILDFVLAPANASDLEVGFELLNEHTHLAVLGDKAYISTEKAAELLEMNRLRLQTLPRKNQKQQLPAEVQHLFNAVRQMIETVNGQLSEQFHVEKNHAHTFWGLVTRLVTKLTAHTLCIYINRLLGKSNFLQIKALAFPN
ncbi:MAG TPA: IS982 family transposase [Anaerolineales bacterium]|nr:IS982 family transposase [Anaerolineales bacterium]